MSSAASRWLTALTLAGTALALAGCDRRDDAPPPPPADSRPLPKARPAAGAEDPYAGVTPMEEREAVLGLLNKRNGLVRDIRLKPGQSVRIGRAVVRLRACERTAQWEYPQETGAFVQLVVLDHGSEDWRRVFSGWLFKERPDRNVVQHPIYDVFVKSCTMRWPGEIELRESSGDPSSSRSSAPQSPSATAPTDGAGAAPADQGPAAPPPAAPAPAPTAAPATEG